MKKLMPKCLSFVLCERIIEDANSGRLTLVDVIDSLSVPEVPYRLNRLAICVSLSDARGVVPFEVHVYRDGESEPLAEINNVDRFADPLEVRNVLVEFSDLELYSEGSYFVQFFAKGTMLAERRVMVEIAAHGESETDGNDDEDGL
jgi:hypothetical protein